MIIDCRFIDFFCNNVVAEQSLNTVIFFVSSLLFWRLRICLLLLKMHNILDFIQPLPQSKQHKPV